MILPPLYAICDADVCARAGWTLVDVAAACVRGGARLLQIRAKTSGSRSVLDVTVAIVELAHRAGATVIVNDRADIAVLGGADGVHVGQEDLTVRAVRTIVGPDRVVGLSTHTTDQLRAACVASMSGLDRVSYAAIGPVFSTSTKVTGYTSVGVDMVKRAAAVASDAGVPLVAIGGITLETAPDVIRAGAASVAVVSDLLHGGDPERRVRAYVERLI